jgi:hypothetical protein
VRIYRQENFSYLLTQLKQWREVNSIKVEVLACGTPKSFVRGQFGRTRDSGWAVHDANRSVIKKL